MKMRLKGCRRCGGDLFPDQSDRQGVTMSCLQCGLEVRFRIVGATAGLPAREAQQRPVAA